MMAASSGALRTDGSLHVATIMEVALHSLRGVVFHVEHVYTCLGYWRTASYISKPSASNMGIVWSLETETTEHANNGSMKMKEEYLVRNWLC